MTKRIITDSSIWIGAFVEKDKWHENGKIFLEWLKQHNDVLVQIPLGVIYEVIAGILEKSYGGFEKANKALDLFMTHKQVEIYYITEESLIEVNKIFKQYKVFSLVDSSIVLLYINKKCEILFSTDSDYNCCASFINRLEFPI